MGFWIVKKLFDKNRALLNFFEIFREIVWKKSLNYKTNFLFKPVV